MSNREYLNNPMKPFTPGSLAQTLKTPERLWMSILLLNLKQTTPTVEEFSKISDLSVGFISKFSNILRSTGFLAMGQRLKLTQASKLLDIVRDIYFFESNQVIPYFSENTPEQLLKTISSCKAPYALTRMSGASLIAPFVRYQLIDFYISDDKDLEYWKKELKLIDVEVTGNVNIILPQNPRILNEAQTVKKHRIVNNIQLYLDLYKYPSRGREQAEHLREKVLKI